MKFAIWDSNHGGGGEDAWVVDTEENEDEEKARREAIEHYEDCRSEVGNITLCRLGEPVTYERERKWRRR